MTNRIRVFMSYAREDEAFVRDKIVLRLPADRFEVWFDRTSIPAGKSWDEKIHQGLEECDVLLVAVSKAALKSEWVQREYMHALELGKQVIPCRLKNIALPEALQPLQWIDLSDSAAYEKQITKLISDLLRGMQAPLSTRVGKWLSSAGLDTGPVSFMATQAASALDKRREALHNRIAPRPETVERYEAGLRAKAQGDLDGAATYWEQLLKADPHYLNGQLKQEYDALLLAVTPLRIERLRKQADEAADRGEWDSEITALQQLLDLGGMCPDARARMQAARTNLEHQVLYQSAQRLISEGSTAAAREALEKLYQSAPFFGDPQGVARKLGMQPDTVFYRRRQVLEDRQQDVRSQLEIARGEKARLDAERRPVAQQYDAIANTRSAINDRRAGCTGTFVLSVIGLLLLWGGVTVIANITQNPGNAAAAGAQFPKLLLALAVGFVGMRLWLRFRLNSVNVDLRYWSAELEKHLVKLRPVEARIQALEQENKQVRQEANRVVSTAKHKNGAGKPAWRRWIGA